MAETRKWIPDRTAGIHLRWDRSIHSSGACVVVATSICQSSAATDSRAI